MSGEILIKVRNLRYCKKQGEIVDPKQEPKKPGLVPYSAHLLLVAGVDLKTAS